MTTTEAAGREPGRPPHMVRFGTTDLWVSRICQGTAFRNMPRSPDNEVGLRVLQHCLDVGQNFFDSSNGYGMGGSEELLGKAIAGRRDEAVVCTKLVRHDVPAGAKEDDTFEPARYTRDLVFANTDRALSRLGTNFVDLILLHHRDGVDDRLKRLNPRAAKRTTGLSGDSPPTPPEEIIDTMDALVQSGRARYWGVSGRIGEEVEELLEICERSGKAPVSCLQNGYSLIDRAMETEGLFPLLGRTGLGVQAIGPHSAGVLARPAAEVAVSPAVAELGPALSDLIGVADGVAADLGVPRSQVNVAWVLSHPEITTALAAAETPEHVDDNLAGAMLDLPAGAIETLNAASDRFRDLLEEARERSDAS